MLKKFSSWVAQHKIIVALVATVIFVTSGIGLLQAHEPWYDEIVPWMLSEQITPTNYYDVNSAEPHPPLWQAILAVFSQNNAPVQILGYISLAIVALAVFLLWRFAPFGALPKIALTLSAMFFYYNPVIARSYSLVPLAIVLVALVYQRRYEHPLRYAMALALLLQTHFLMWGLGGVLALEFVIGYIKRMFSKQVEREHFGMMWLILAVAIVGAAVALCAPTIVGCFERHAIVTGATQNAGGLGAFSDALNRALFGTQAPVFELTLVATLLCLLVCHTKWFFMPAVALGYMYFVMVFVYAGYEHLEQKAATFLAVLFLAFWVTTGARYSENKFAVFGRELLKKSEIVSILGHFAKVSAATMFVLPFALSIPHTVTMAHKDIEGAYDDSLAIAEVLNGFPEESVFVLMDSGSAGNFTAATPFLTDGRTFYSSLSDAPGAILDYDVEFYDAAKNGISDEAMNVILQRLRGEYEHVYYIALKPGCASALPTHSDVLEGYDVVSEYAAQNYMSSFAAKYWIYQVR